MKLAQSSEPVAYPYSWSQLAYGCWTYHHLQSHLDEWLSKLFGFHMLKLGGLSCELSTTHSNIPHQVCVDKFSPLSSLRADSYALPFIEKAFDICILANQLDHCDDPHRLLREIDRVICDDGYLILSGINPCSWLGIGHLIPWRKNRLPWAGRLFSPLRVRDWLALLNYEVIEFSCFGLWPTTKHYPACCWAENNFSDCLPALGSIYFFVARKRTYPLTPIEPYWQLKKNLLPRASALS